MKPKIAAIEHRSSDLGLMFLSSIMNFFREKQTQQQNKLSFGKPEASLLRLAGTIKMDMNEGWITGNGDHLWKSVHLRR